MTTRAAHPYFWPAFLLVLQVSLGNNLRHCLFCVRQVYGVPKQNPAPNTGPHTELGWPEYPRLDATPVNDLWVES